MIESDLMSLAERFPTPFYLFDAGALERRVGHLRAVLPRGISLCYAMKSNPFLTREVSGLVERLEICSPGEYAICRRLGLEAGQYVISGVYKDGGWMEELARRADAEEMVFTVESQAQYHLLRRVARKYGRRLKLLLRLTSASQFGLERQELEQLLECPDPRLEVRGVQYFSGTQKTSARRLARELSMLEQLLDQLQARYGPMAELELGTGFPVSYFADDAGRDEEMLTEAARQLAQLSFPGKLTLELGRSIAAGCGQYVTRVVDRKTSGGQNYAIVDGGIHHLVYYGQGMAMRRPQVSHIPDRPGGGAPPWSICGCLCTVNDILVKQLPLARLEVGDLLVFGQAGAYCMTEGISLFLSRDLPGVLLRRPDGQVRCLRGPLPTWTVNTPNETESENDVWNSCLPF